MNDIDIKNIIIDDIRGTYKEMIRSNHGRLQKNNSIKLYEPTLQNYFEKVVLDLIYKYKDLGGK